MVRSQGFATQLFLDSSLMRFWARSAQLTRRQPGVLE
jgi:hypothetical protein